MDANPRTAAVTTAHVERDPDLARRGPEAYVGELVGTFLLVFFICAVFTVNSAGVLGVTDWAVIGLVQFLALTVLVHTLGGVSGGHFNPAVTATLAALRKIGGLDAAIYVGMQVVGALLAALLLKFLLDDAGDAASYGAPELADALDGEPLRGFAIEAIGAFALMWAVMGVAVNPRGARDWAGLTIGGAYGLVVLALGPLTGGAANPARALGPSLVGGGEPVADFIVAYVLGPLVGALLAGMLYTAAVLGPQVRSTGRRPVATLSGTRESVRDEGAPPPDVVGD